MKFSERRRAKLARQRKTESFDRAWGQGDSPEYDPMKPQFRRMYNRKDSAAYQAWKKNPRPNPKAKGGG